MKDTMGFLLREAWKKAEKQECLHPELRKEYSFSAVATGSYICTTCGYLFLITPLG